MKIINMIAIASVLLAVTIPLLVSYFCGGQMSVYGSPPYSFYDIPDLTGKVAIVTGSNTGLGYITARELAKKGTNVIVAARSAKKGEDAIKRIKSEIGSVPGADLLEYMILDLSIFVEVQQFASAFNEKGISLDMLVLNAAVMGTPMASLLPARIVHVSSLGHRSTYLEGIHFDSFKSDVRCDPFLSYGQSKLANILFSNELARQLNGTGVTSNSLHPGIIKTELGRHLVEASKKDLVSGFLYGVFGVFIQLVLMREDDGALTQLYVATSPKIEGVTGEYFSLIGIRSSTSAHAKDEAMQRKLWEESERLIEPFW